MPKSAEESLRALWKRFAATRDLDLRARLIERYLPLARATALRYYRLRADDSVAFEDYLQYARIGLVEAIDDYDPAREASFETYSSYRIRGALLNGLGRESESAAQRRFWRTRAQERLAPLSIGAAMQVCSEAQLSSDWNDLFERSGSDPTGLETSGSSVTLEQVLDGAADETIEANPHEAAEHAELSRLLHEAIDKLPARERALMRGHYLEQREFRQIAIDLALTPGRVSQLHARALVRIRRMLRELGS